MISEQALHQILHLRQHKKSLPDAQFFRRFHLGFQGLHIVKENKPCFAVYAVGKIPGT